MAEKKSFVLRVDERTFAALERWAADEFRSVNGQLEWLIVKALKDAGRQPKPPSESTPSVEKEDKTSTPAE